MKTPVSVTFLLLTLLFCVCLIVSNLIEIKTVGIGPLTITAGVVVFPLSYILNDCITEVYGFARAKLVIWLGFAMNLLATLLLQGAVMLPGAPGWAGQEAMETVYGAAPRILAASFTAFVCGSMVNAWVMHTMKASAGAAPTGLRGRFSVRAIISTLWGEGTDSLIFFPIAFGGVFSWETIVTLIVTQTLLKTAYEIAVLPVTLRAVRWLRAVESAVGMPGN